MAYFNMLLMELCYFRCSYNTKKIPEYLKKISCNLNFNISTFWRWRVEKKANFKEVIQFISFSLTPTVIAMSKIGKQNKTSMAAKPSASYAA